MRSTFFKLTLATLSAVVAFAGTESSANAFWLRHGGSSGGYGSSGGSSGGWGSSGGSSGGWGSSGGSSGGWYGSSGGSSGGWGSSGGSSGGYSRGGLFHHHHRANWGSYGSSGGSYGGWGSSGGSSGGWGSSGGSSGGWGSSGGSSGGWVSGYGSTNGVIIDDNAAPTMTPPAAAPGTMPAAPAPGPALPGGAAPPKPAGVQLNPANDFRTATVNVQVPGEAKVFVNGMATTSTGAFRRYVSNGLEPGYSYTYELRAEIVRDGKTVTDVKSIKLKAGENANVNFSFEKGDNQIAKEPVRTSLTLHVPADAKVFLSGNPTQLAGGVREFATTKLANGEKWNDYVVRVELQRDGQVLSKEQTVSLNGGDNKQLTIDFDVAQVARNER